MRSEEIAALIAEVVRACEKDLDDGAMVSATDSGIWVRRLLLYGGAAGLVAVGMLAEYLLTNT